MDTIVRQISEIETAAVKIMNESSLQKKELDDEIKQRMDTYDAEVDSKTARQIQSIRTDLDSRMQRELSSLREHAGTLIMNLENEYALSHEALANHLLKQMIEE